LRNRRDNDDVADDNDDVLDPESNSKGNHYVTERPPDFIIYDHY